MLEMFCSDLLVFSGNAKQVETQRQSSITTTNNSNYSSDFFLSDVVAMLVKKGATLVIMVIPCSFLKCLGAVLSYLCMVRTYAETA